MATTAHSGGDGTDARRLHEDVWALGAADHRPSAGGPPAAARRGSRWA